MLFYRVAILLECVDNSADVTEDTRQFAETVDVVMYALCLIPLDEWSCLVVVNVKTLLDSLSVVVRTTALLATLYETCHKLVLRNVKLNHCCYLVSALCKHLLESLCLRDCTGKSVEDNALVLLAEAVVYACEDINHKLIGDKLAVVNKSLGCLAKLCSVLDFVAEHVTSRDMVEAILLDHKVALGALA